MRRVKVKSGAEEQKIRYWVISGSESTRLIISRIFALFGLKSYAVVSCRQDVGVKRAMSDSFSKPESCLCLIFIGVVEECEVYGAGVLL